jgi:hypothetical protein
VIEPDALVKEAVERRLKGANQSNAEEFSTV